MSKWALRYSRHSDPPLAGHLNPASAGDATASHATADATRDRREMSMRERYPTAQGGCQALPQNSSVLDGGADVEDVAVADDVFLAFETHLAALARLGFR